MKNGNDNPVYYDVEKNKFYWIEWTETGNSDIPTRHYIKIEDAFKVKKKKKRPCSRCGGSGKLLDHDDVGEYEVECEDCRLS